MSKSDDFNKRNAELISRAANDTSFIDASHRWFQLANKYEYSYHFTWLSRPVIQYPQDIIAVQEVIWQAKPDLIIETGIAHGGSLILSASMLTLLDHCDAVRKGEIIDPRKPSRRVLGIDIDIRAENRRLILEHPLSSRIEMIEGSSISERIIEQVHYISSNYSRVMVLLDANHTHEHVLAELNAYAPLVNIGSYCITFDTIIESMPPGSFPNRPWGEGNSPRSAVVKYLETHPEFVIDNSIHEKLMITVAPNGYLKRIR